MAVINASAEPIKSGTVKDFLTVFPLSWPVACAIPVSNLGFMTGIAEIAVVKNVYLLENNSNRSVLTSSSSSKS